MLTIRVKDSGGGFDYKRMLHSDPKLEGYSGRGIPLLTSLCDSVVHHGKGNDAEVTFNWSYSNGNSHRNIEKNIKDSNSSAA